MSDLLGELHAMLTDLHAKYPPLPAAIGAHPADIAELRRRLDPPPIGMLDPFGGIAIYQGWRCPRGRVYTGTRAEVFFALGLCACCAGERIFMNLDAIGPFLLCAECAGAGCAPDGQGCQYYRRKQETP
jgi:hypothetical protein